MEKRFESLVEQCDAVENKIGIIYDHSEEFMESLHPFVQEEREIWGRKKFNLSSERDPG